MVIAPAMIGTLDVVFSCMMNENGTSMKTIVIERVCFSILVSREQNRAPKKLHNMMTFWGGNQRGWRLCCLAWGGNLLQQQ